MLGRRDQDGVLRGVLRLHRVKVLPEDMLNSVITKRVEGEFDVAGEVVRQVVVSVDDHDDRTKLCDPAVDHVKGRRHMRAVEFATLTVQAPADTGIDLHVKPLRQRRLRLPVTPGDCGQDRVRDHRYAWRRRSRTGSGLEQSGKSYGSDQSHRGCTEAA